MALQRTTANDVTHPHLLGIWERLLANPQSWPARLPQSQSRKPCCLGYQPCGKDNKMPSLGNLGGGVQTVNGGPRAKLSPKSCFRHPVAGQGSQDQLSRPGNNRHELATISISRWSSSFHSANLLLCSHLSPKSVPICRAQPHSI